MNQEQKDKILDWAIRLAWIGVTLIVVIEFVTDCN